MYESINEYLEGILDELDEAFPSRPSRPCPPGQKMIFGACKKTSLARSSRQAKNDARLDALRRKGSLG